MELLRGELEKEKQQRQLSDIKAFEAEQRCVQLEMELANVKRKVANGEMQKVWTLADLLEGIFTRE